MKKSFLYPLFTIITYTCIGQGHATQLFTKKDGLPVNSIITIFQDSKGFLWVSGYPSYISRFDGTRFENYDLNQIDPDRIKKPVTTIIEDSLGVIWFKSSNQDLMTWKDGNFEKILLPQELSNNWHIHYSSKAKRIFIIEYLADSIIEYVFDPQKEVFKEVFKIEAPHPPGPVKYSKPNPQVIKMGCNTKNLRSCSTYSIQVGKQFIELPESPFFKFEEVWQMIVISEDLIIAMTSSAVHPIPKPGIFKLYKFNGKKWSPFSTKWNQNDETYLLEGSDIFEIQGQLFLRLKKDSRNAEIVRFGCNKEEFERFPFFSGSRFTGTICHDQAGTFWQGTHKGLLRIFPWFITLQPTENHSNMPTDIFSLGQDQEGKIWIGSYGSGLFYLDSKKFAQPGPNGLNTFQRFLPGNINDQEGNMLFSLENDTLRGILKYDGKKSINTLLPGIPGFFFAKHADEKILYASNQGIFRSKSNRLCNQLDCWDLILNKEHGLSLSSTQTIAIDENKSLYWMGREGEGVSVYDYGKNQIFNFPKKGNPNKLAPISILVDQNGGTWFGGREGLFFLRSDSKIDSSFKLNDELEQVGKIVLSQEGQYKPQSIRAIKTLHDTSLVLTTESGFALLDLKTFYQSPRKEKILFFGNRNGYQIGEGIQNCILVSTEDDLWMAGQNGLVCFKPKLYEDKSHQVQVQIDSCRIGENIFYPNNEGSILAPPGEFLVEFWISRKAPNPLLENHFTFFGKISNASQYQAPISGGKISFIGAPGKLTFEFIGTSNGKLSLSISQTIIFKQHFYQRPLFWLIIFSILFLATFIWYRTLQKWQEEKNMLQVQAIVNHLNPHFIKNALQVLQLSVYKAKDMDAFHAIHKIGNNIGTVFKNAREQNAFHSLKEELNFVHNYLDIQQLQYKDAISFNLPSHKEIHQWGHIKVPIMLIQIHCENAIVHGIMTKKPAKGTVSVSLEEKEASLIIHIKDDGIGPISASKLGSHGTQKGINMIEEIMRIYNKKNKQKMTRTAIGQYLKNQDGIGYGMHVILEIPKTYRYE